MKEVSTELKFGMKVKERITGIEGTIIGITKYAYERPIALVAYKDNVGVMHETWLAVDRLEVL